MQTDLFRVIFTGKLDGAIPVEVTKANLVELLGQNHKKTAPFFNGKPFVIKKKIDRAAAEKYRITFKKAGAICIIKPESVRRKAPLEEFCDSNSPSTKPLCTITTVDIGKVDLKFSPLTCSQLTGISEGIKTHRPEKNTVKFSEIQSLSICSHSGSIQEAQVLFFVKGLMRPVSVKYDKIKFSDFSEKTAVSHIDSIKQVIKHLYEKCPNLVMDKNTYEFFSSKGGALPKEDPTRLSTAMGYVLNPAKKKPVNPVAATVLKRQALEKVKGGSSAAADRRPVNTEREEIEKGPLLNKTRQTKFLTLKVGLIGIFLLAGLSYTLWYGYEKRIQMDARVSAVKAEKDRMLCQLYLLYTGAFPFEIQNAEAIEQCNTNISQLIEASRIFIRYIDENKMYLGDAYLEARDYAIIMPLSRINVFAFKLFKAGSGFRDPRIRSAHLRKLESDYKDMAVLGYIKHSYNYNVYYFDEKFPNESVRLKIDKISAYGWPVAETIEKLRRKLSYSYGCIETIKQNVTIVLSNSLRRFFDEVEVPMIRGMEPKIDAYMNLEK